MPQINVDSLDNIEEVRREEGQGIDKNARIPRLSHSQLRDLAKILHEMLRRDLMLERDRMGR